MKSRPRIKFLQLPHSVAQRIESLTNRTAAALLALLCRKTIGFGRGIVELSYQQLSESLNVGTRAVARAAKLLESAGDILRDRSIGGVYRWTILLEKDEVIADPHRTYKVRSQTSPLMINRSTPSSRSDHDPHDPSIMTPSSHVEHPATSSHKDSGAEKEHAQDPLKILIKDKDLKTHHSAFETSSPKRCTGDAPQEHLFGAPAVHQSKTDETSDDEPLHKICLKRLRAKGVSQRMARKLCKEQSHQLIISVLDSASKRSNIKNLPAYIVSEIQDGGYQSPIQPKERQRCTTGAPAVHQNKSVAPITYRSVEQTQAEKHTIQAQKTEQELAYRQKSRQLADRFKALSEDLQLRLKLTASVHLSKLIPTSDKREQMLNDKTFQRMANRTILEHFFQSIDQGLDHLQALKRLETRAIAS